MKAGAELLLGRTADFSRRGDIVILFDDESWPTHRPWFYFVFLVTLLAVAWFVATMSVNGVWPSGSSPVGLVLGIAGGLLIVFECLLWLRKRYRSMRVGRVKVWMIAHIWLGLLTFPLIVLHSGFRWGGVLSTILMVLFLIVIASGIFGLWLQNWIPRHMLLEIPSETIYGQIDRQLEQMRIQAEELVHTVCGVHPETSQGDNGAQRESDFFAFETTLSEGAFEGKTVQTVAKHGAVVGAEPILHFHIRHVQPYLEKGSRAPTPIVHASRAKQLFAELARRLPKEAVPTLGILQSFCDLRRQFDQQALYHRWLHGWLLIHAPLSMALLVLMFLHILVATKYW